jgi:3-hydroxyacyl-CoA dehydrogenase
MLIQYLSESLKLHERGDASFQDIDIAMKLGAGYLIVKVFFKPFQFY